MIHSADILSQAESYPPKGGGFRPGTWKIKFDDYDEVCDVVTSVVKDWFEIKDIRSFEEEGYISTYARRVLQQMFPVI